MLDNGRINPLELVKNKMMLAMIDSDKEPDLEKMALLNMLESNSFDMTQLIQLKMLEKL